MATRALIIALIVACGSPLLRSAGTTPSHSPAGTAPPQDYSKDQEALKPNTRPPRRIQLAAQNGSGMTGLISLNTSLQNPHGTDVYVGFNQVVPNTSYFANIYFGNCSSPGEVAYQLNKVENGRSDSTLPSLYYELFIDKDGGAYRGPYAILVSKTADKKTAVACGDLPGPGGSPVQKVELVPDKSTSEKPQGSGGEGAEAIDLVGSDGSTVVAKAWFNAAGPNKTRATVKLSQANSNGKYSANVVFGVCEDPGGEAFKLSKFQHGASTTDLPISFSTSNANGQRYAIMVNQGPTPEGARLACGSFTGGR
jgi:hypothetical protein